MKKTNKLQFQTVPAENDELINAIVEDPQRQDDRWNLHEQIDPGAIERFWDDAIRDLGNEST
ncbi:MAG TPA: hypothetical protein VNG90_05680 [Candidatus Acidoferrum sp.]|nr:hypothetical protein [Candidatus Acidoferrum sp.]